MQCDIIIFPFRRIAAIALLFVCCLKTLNGEPVCSPRITRIIRVLCIDKLGLDDLDLYNITKDPPEVCENICRTDLQCTASFTDTVQNTCALYRPKVPPSTTVSSAGFKDILKYDTRDKCAIVPEPECVDASGWPYMYKGRKMTTRTGITCQRWDTDIPHTNDKKTPEKYFVTSLSEAENFCRIPSYDLNEVFPWCLTTDSTVLWEYCDIPFCEV